MDAEAVQQSISHINEERDGKRPELYVIQSVDCELSFRCRAGGED